MKHVPNILTFSRIFVIPLIIGSFYLDFPYSNWTAFLLFTTAGITDFFDGYIARSYDLISKMGQFFDPIADKLMIVSVIVMLVAFDRLSGVHVFAGLIILAREFLVAGLREFLSDLKVSVPVTILAKWKTAFQMIALGGLLWGEAAPSWLPVTEISLGLLWISAVLTLYTGFDYMKAGLKHF